jgi:hypothetical protein
MHIQKPYNYNHQYESCCVSFGNWKKTSSSTNKMLLSVLIMTFILSFINFVFSFTNIVMMNDPDLFEYKCNTTTIMLIFNSIQFFEFCIFLFFAGLILFVFNFSKTMYVLIACVATISVCIAAGIYGEDCFIDDNIKPDKVASEIKYQMIFTFCKWVLNVAFCIAVFMTTDDTNTHTNRTYMPSDKLFDEVSLKFTSYKKRTSFVLHSLLFVWKCIIIGCLAPSLIIGNREYYFVIATIGVFIGKYSYIIRSSSDLSSPISFNYKFVNITTHIMAILSLPIIIVLLVYYERFDFFSGSLVYKFDHVLLMFELYQTSLVYIYRFYVICNDKEPLNSPSYYDEVKFIAESKKREEHYNSLIFNKIYYCWIIISEIIHLIIYLTVLIMIGYYLDKLSTTTCNNTETYLNFYMGVQFFSIITGSQILKFFISGENYDYYCFANTIIHGILVCVEMVCVIFFVLIPCYSPPLIFTITLFIMYICTFVRFVFISDNSKITLFNNSYNLGDIGKTIIKAVLFCFVVMTFIFWCVCAAILSNSGMGVYGGINENFFQKNFTEQISVYSREYENNIFVYETKTNQILNVYNGIDPLCIMCEPCNDYKSSACACERENCVSGGNSMFRLQDWFVINYIFIFMEYLAQLFFLVPIVCCFTKDQITDIFTITYAVTSVILHIMNICSVMAVTYSSPSGSMFIYLENPVSTILYLHIFLQMPINVFMNAAISYIIYS